MFRKIIALISIIGAILIISASTPTSHPSGSNSYDVVCIYEAINIPSGSKALDSYSNIKDVKAVYVPTKVDTGKYTVDITRIDSNFYQICGTELYIETRYCYEYATREEVVLNITSNYGYTRGEVIFF